MNENYVTKCELIEQLELLKDLNQKLFKALEMVSQKNHFYEERFIQQEFRATC